ncbi:hypothetical protein C6A85_71800, partial [Mycobacterium sp. ITM-2017-0098]
IPVQDTTMFSCQLRARLSIRDRHRAGVLVFRLVPSAPRPPLSVIAMFSRGVLSRQVEKRLSVPIPDSGRITSTMSSTMTDATAT